MLDWREAGEQHRSDLSVFRCADPANVEFFDDEGRQPVAAPWEFVVEDYINQLHPPAYSPEFIQVGYRDAWLTAVIAGRVFPLDRYCFMAALGVAHLDSGHGLALEALDRIHVIMATYGITEDYISSGYVDPQNDPVQSSLSSRGYVHVRDVQGLQEWSQIFTESPRWTR